MGEGDGMITIHEKTAQTFETLGLGALVPNSCIVTEELNGAYELELSTRMTRAANGSGWNGGGFSTHPRREENSRFAFIM